MPASMIDRSPRAFVFLNTDGANFLTDDAWLRRTRTLIVQMKALPSSVDSEWDFSLAMMDSCVAVAYFAAVRLREGLAMFAAGMVCRCIRLPKFAC